MLNKQNRGVQKVSEYIHIILIDCKLVLNRKTQLTQRGTRDSGACLKAHCEQNLSSPISAIDTVHHNLHLFINIRQLALQVSRGCCCSSSRKRALWRGTPLCCFRAQASLSVGGQDLGRLNWRLMLKISYAGCPGLLSDFGEMCLAAQNRQKSIKPLF